MTYRDVVKCRFCEAPLRHVLDLGETPIANNLCATQALALDAPRFPLVLCQCTARDCGLYQLSIAVDAETLYGNYTYATPKNPELDDHYERALNWINEAVEFAEASGVCVEIGSNNGAFLERIPDPWSRLGVDPSPVQHADRFLPRIQAPFTKGVLEHAADLIIARHCLAHVDDVHAVVEGVAHHLAENGFFYIENAYWIDSMLGAQFDQVYHEHMSYLTIEAVQHLLRQHGMRLVDVNFSEIHGGSFMLLASRADSLTKPTVNVPVALRAERAWLAQGLEERFVEESRWAIEDTYAAVMAEFSQKHVVDAYGASAKAVTRFSAAKITHEHVRQCIDDSPIKQGKFLPGSGIPIVSRVEAWGPETVISRGPIGVRASGDAPNAVLLTAWNYERSFREREREYLRAGGRFIR